MHGPRIDEQTIRGLLRTKRKLLLEEFRGKPSDVRLAIEIRLIDDRIAELTRCLVPEQESEPD
jgi:hypothetical protein